MANTYLTRTFRSAMEIEKMDFSAWLKNQDTLRIKYR